MRCAALLLLLAAPAFADDPLSAIPWLSEAGTSEPALSGRPLPVSPDTGEVAVSSLDQTVRGGIGLLSPGQTGLPPDLWGPTTTQAVADRIAAQPAGRFPATRQLFRTLLLAQAAPPLGDEAGAFLLVRVDRLIDLGQLDAAEALVKAAGSPEPALFQRAADVGLLTERTGHICRQLAAAPALSDDYRLRVFCLARSGDWRAAALTLRASHAVDAIDPEDELLLARFLDPVLFEEAQDPPHRTPLTPMAFVLREATALPRPPTALPLQFLHADVAPHAPMRARIAAGERLARAEAIEPGLLLAAYRAGRPAASGGVWDRADAVQSLDHAVASGNARESAAALVAADDLFLDLGLRPVLAEGFARALARFPADSFDDRARQRVFELMLLAEVPAARHWRPDPPRPETELAAYLVGVADEPPGRDRLSPLDQALVDGLLAETPPTEAAKLAVRLVDGGRTGEAILKALDFLSTGFGTDPEDVSAALFVLRSANQDHAARRIALEMLLLRPGA